MTDEEYIADSRRRLDEALAKSRAAYAACTPEEKAAWDERTASMAAKMQSSLPSHCFPKDHPEYKPLPPDEA